ncbi:MAG: Alkaline phosphatase synthesis sensor protein PhoR [Syntrophorhabdus sp. PtaU1.Bin002]|nr:MAG: Alkaline phosphatase synthesis sensor protein PhoR [Syntrophorhabdus sp. PtaU1.Bin002]
MAKGKIFEAIFNFVGNAIKYTSEGVVVLKIELASESCYEPRNGDDDAKGPISGPVIRVTVSDTGMGISKEDIPYLFAKFSRRDAAHMNSEGTGLGLYVVKLVIEAHGGRTWAESEGEGEGSRFVIEIPVNHAA